jgi:hypothetical protein
VQKIVQRIRSIAAGRRIAPDARGPEPGLSTERAPATPCDAGAGPVW